MLASRTYRFNPEIKASGTHWVVGWVGPRAGMYAVAKRKKVPSLALPGIEPWSSSR